jgi:hypothetical protein
MKPDCRNFRSTLERALEDTRGTGELTSLSWHEHLLGCGDCRALLEAEEALEMLLESLPQPHLPPRLARRVLARLRAGVGQREAALDRLLELDPGARAPGDLARRVLAGLEAQRAQPAEARLDGLLERARAVEVPAALAQRVLAHVAEERRLGRRRKPVFARRSVQLAAAAGLLALLAAWAFWPRAQTPGPREVAHAPESVDPRMLEHFELLEQWDLLRRNDLDALLSTLPHSDQVLLEMGSEEGLLGG